MKEFFRGWKRKVGLVTLGLALILLAGWVRSEFTYDSIVKSYRNGRIVLFSISGCIGLHQRQYGNEFRIPDPFLSFHTEAVKRRTRFVGFQGSGRRDDGSRWWETYAVPYSLIVIPLTLISAFLLLTKPRKLAQKNTAEPIAKEGA